MHCAVCGCADARALLSTKLATGAPIVLCGTHDLMHRRSGRRAESPGELRALVRDRRDTTRRLPVPDELGARLIEAFSTTVDRRVGERRRG